MKRVIILLILVFLFVAFVSAQNNTGDDNISLKESVREFEKSFEGTKEKTDKALEKPIPEKLQPIAKRFFRFELTEDQDVMISEGIIALMIFVVILLFFVDVMKTFSPFSENTATFIGIILGVLTAMVGIIKSITIFLLNLGGQFSFLEHWSAGALVFATILTIIVAIVMLKLMKVVKQHKGLAKAYERGAKAGADLAYTEAQRKVLEKSS